MFLNWLFLLFVGLCAGGMIAAGVFAFLVMIGVFPRVIGRTHTGEHIFLYETVIVIGGTLGNLLDLYEFPIPVGVSGTLLGHPLFGEILLGLFGLGSGLFIGCLVMSLAETLKAIPVISRRICLSVGLPYIILSIALGKLCGSLYYFIAGIGR